jgi:hypothetical protein
MIALALLNMLPVYYLGGIVVALFIVGLLYSWLNAWRQGRKPIRAGNTRAAFKPERSSDSQQESERKEEVPQVVVAS